MFDFIDISYIVACLLLILVVVVFCLDIRYLFAGVLCIAAAYAGCSSVYYNWCEGNRMRAVVWGGIMLFLALVLFRQSAWAA